MITVSITHGTGALPAPPEPCVMALGFFDGVHLGHRQVIGRARELADLHGIKLAVLTFDPHPREVIGRGAVSCLTPFAAKEALLAQTGVDLLYVIRFDRQFAALTPHEFVQQYVVGMGARHVVAGFDFTYGHLGKGNMSTIERDGSGFFHASTIPEVKRAGRKISSTIIRESLLAGAVHLIPLYLGDFYESRGMVKQQTVSIRANAETRTQVIVQPHVALPGEGSYEVEVRVGRHVRITTAWVGKQADGSPMLEIEWSKPHAKINRDPVIIKWLSRLDPVSRTQSEEGVTCFLKNERFPANAQSN
ncbi:adenylyltransferase/cytidyltransferase family protein [Brevibacillus fluminis]|uniref:adenylyltransferase/cytidyltransferase family protein n=1 Tax=Brevibacillus fluminis TaxID=511487 RepID=UPI003F88D943